MTKGRGYTTHSASNPLRLFDFERRSACPTRVVIEILPCGVCHSDVHNARNDWGHSLYPMVPGHEIVGCALEVAADVNRFMVGDSVGVGCKVDSCQTCAACSNGLEQYYDTGAHNAVDSHDGLPIFGGYSDRIVVSGQFVLRIPDRPDRPDRKGTAPLLCAGITTWSPLRHWNVVQGSKVTVIGLGGLGYMALKLAKALGADVTLRTRSPGKEAAGRRLGADHVIVSTNAAHMATVAGKFDLLIDTVPY